MINDVIFNLLIYVLICEVNDCFICILIACYQLLYQGIFNEYLVYSSPQQQFSDIVAAKFIGGGNPGENNRPVVSELTEKLQHIMLYRVTLVEAGFELTNLVVKSTDCIGSCKSNYNTITTTTAAFTVMGVVCLNDKQQLQ